MNLIDRAGSLAQDGARMALLPKARRDPGRDLVAFALAAGVPLACYLATASAHGYWLDGGEFVGAAVSLGIAHPPGHPLQALIAKAFTLLPIGSIPLRVALQSAVLGALAAGFLFRAIDTTVRSLGVVRDRLAMPIALGATWLVAASYGWWFQSVRPEVYSLQAVLVMVALERIITLEAAWPSTDVRPVYVASLALGLALANHHFLAFLVLPAMAPTMARVKRARGLRPLLLSGLAVATGLCTYIYLPIRAATDPAVDMGHPTNLASLFWVVSAKAFQKNTGSGVPQPMAERFADLGVLLVQNLHWIPLLLALLGAWALLRTAGARRIGYVWLAVLGVFVAARAWLGFVRANPDALGYLMPAFGAIGALAAAAVAVVLVVMAGGHKAKPPTFAVLIALAVSLLGLAQIHRSVDRASLADFSATDAFDDGLRRDLPPRAVVLAYAPQTVFRFWGGEGSEQTRPDVVLVPMPFLTYPGMVASLVARAPELRDVLRGYLLDGELRQPDLQTLAARRPVLVEMDVRVPPTLYETLVPNGLYYQVLAGGATDGDEREGARSWDAAFAQLDALLGPHVGDPETRAQLLWRSYTAALYFAGFGDRTHGKAAVARGLAIDPTSTELRGLRHVLSDATKKGPIDIGPYRLQRGDD